nr:uncharacterized protein LOC123757283 isoform X1 [Procambarus clarkii]
MEKHDSDEASQYQQWSWQQLSPRNLDHRVRIPTAITLHRLVPKAPTPTTKHTFKHFKADEIQQAQLKARYKLLKARLAHEQHAAPASDCNQSTKPVASTSDNNENTKPAAFTKVRGSDDLPHQQNEQRTDVFKRLSKTGVGKSVKLSETSKKVATKRPLPLHQGIGESNLRIRQVTRLIFQISNSVKELENLKNQTCFQRDFVTPYDDEVKRKRWEEFLHFAGRSLFSLRREVSVMERKSNTEEKNNSIYLRMLAVSTRTIHRLLLALKTHSENAFVSTPGKKLFVELISITERIFALVYTIGVRPPRLNVQIRPETAENFPLDSSTESSEVATSDIDADALTILQPKSVQDRIAKLAFHRFKKKRKKTAHGKDRITRDKKSSEPKELSAAADEGHSCRHSVHHARRKSPEVSMSEGKKSPFRKTRSPERNTSPKQYASAEKNSILEKGASNTKPDIQYLTVDGHQIVEDTADAVVNRLQQFFEGETQEKEEKIHRPVAEEMEGQGEQKDECVANITQQIHYLLERVCKIEEEHRKTQEIVSEVSLRMETQHSSLDVSLETAIQKAKQVMSTLGDSNYNTFKHDAPMRSPKEITFHKNNIIPQRTVDSITNFKLSANHCVSDVGASMAEKEFEAGIQIEKQTAATNLEGNLHGEESIKNQLQCQKEEFWASLVKRGFIKPREVTEIGARDIHQVLEMLGQNPHLSLENDIVEKISRETESKPMSSNLRQENARVNKSFATTQTRQEQTLATALVRDKETQIGSPFVTYHSSLFQNKCVKHKYSVGSNVNHNASSENIPDSSDISNSDQSSACEGDESITSDHVSKGPSRDISSENSNSHQSSLKAKNDGSGSFPSYDGVSNSE